MLAQRPERTAGPSVDVAAPVAPRSSPRGVLVGGLVLAVLFTISPMRIVGDSRLVFADAHSIVYDRDLDLTEFADAPAVTGAYSFIRTDDGDFDFFPWMSALLAVPAVVVLDAAHAVGIGDGSDAMIRSGASGLDDLQAMIASLAAAATAAVLATAGLRLLRRWRHEEGRPRRVSWKVEALAVVAVGTATPLWSTVSRALWQHVPADFALAVAILAATCATDPDRTMEHRARSAFVATVAAVLVAWARPASVGVALVVVLAMVLSSRSRRIRRSVVAAAVATTTVVLAINVVLLGTWRPMYLGGDRLGGGALGLHARYSEAIVANLISPARGALVYSSIALVGGVVAWRLGGVLARAAGVAAIGSLAVLVSVSAYGYQWWGGFSYGPRFMTEAILASAPVALAGLIEFVDQRREAGYPGVLGTLAAVALVASVALHGIGAWSESAWEWNRDPADIDEHPSRVWEWEDPPFLRPFGFGDRR
jgi:hypothetical protein